MQSLVMFIGSIQIMTNLMLFSALAKKQASFHFNSRSVMNGVVNVLWKYCCGVPTGVFVESPVASNRV